MFVLIDLCLGLASWALMAVDLWIAHALIGMIWGICIALIWMMGDAIYTVEYWRSACPRWIYILFGHPGHVAKNVNADIRYMKFLYKIIKPFAVIIAVAVSFVFITRDTGIKICLIETLTYVIAWLLSVYISERYFRRRYTRIKDWSKFKPFDESE
jgi:hypothetical protein